jgi:hypothetical protein
VPLLNLFRHSAVFRLFFVFGLLLVAAQSLNAYFAQVPQRRISCTTVLASLTALAIAAAAYWGLKRVGWEGATRFWSQPSFEWLALDGKLPEMLGLYGGVQLVLAAVLLGLLLGRAKIGWMVGLVVLDIALSVQCLMWGPILEAGHTLSDPESDLVTYQHGPTLDLETPFGEFHNGRHEMRAFWTNEHFIVRHPAIDGYGRPTLRFEAFQTMCISKCVWMNPVAYIPSEVLPYSDSASVCNSPRPGVAFAAVEQAQVFPDSSTSVKLESLGFTHNAFRFRVTGALANRMVVLQQNDYPEWRATFNHHPLPTVPVNYTEIAARLPADAPNAGELEFRYAPLPWVQWATKVSYAALGLFGFWAVMRGLRRLWLRS